MDHILSIVLWTPLAGEWGAIVLTRADRPDLWCPRWR